MNLFSHVDNRESKINLKTHFLMNYKYNLKMIYLNHPYYLLKKFKHLNIKNWIKGWFLGYLFFIMVLFLLC